jgi:GNAT superfamily N-acetyltransferase
MSDYEISFDPARVDVEAAHAFLAGTYWARDIPLAVVRKAIANSLCVAAFAAGRQVGFARVVTDRATFGYLADVYVLEEHRGRGLSKRMLEALFAHPELQGLRRMMLVTRDAHRLYEGFGFTPLAHADRVMERHDPEVYSRTAESGRDSAGDQRA